MKKRVAMIGVILILISLIIILSNPLKNITGFIIAENISNLSIYIGMFFLFSGLIVLFASGEGNLEDRVEQESPPNPAQENESEEERVNNYVSRYAPSHLKDHKSSWLYGLNKLIGRLRLREVTGKENLPQGPKLFILNHRAPYAEYFSLVASLEGEHVHPFVARNFGWKYFPWIAKKIGAIPINASLSNLKEGQQKSAHNIPFYLRPFYSMQVDAVKKENVSYARNTSSVRALASMLLQGRNGLIASEGPAVDLNTSSSLHYGGYGLAVRQYEKIKRKKLPIVPVGISKGRVSFGKPFYIDEGRKYSREELEELATERVNREYEKVA